MCIAYKNIIPFVFLFFIVAITTAQPKCKVEYYSTEQGLSHQRVTALVKDREGFMWFGSWNGINRFDGHSFVSYKSSPGDTSKLVNDRIDQIIEDQSDHLWVQSYDKQVYRFNKKTGQFLPIAPIIHAGAKGKLAFDKILAASNGFVWLQSVSDGVFCVPQTDFSRGRFTRYRKEELGDFHLPSNTINFFYEDREKQIWIGTPNGLACLRNSGSGGYKNGAKIPYEIATGLNVLMADEDDASMYFITDNGNLIIYLKKSGSFSIHKIGPDHLNACLRSKKNRVIYFTTAKGELIILNLQNFESEKISVGTNATLYSIYEDRKGMLWIEPEKAGVIRFDPFSKSFNYFRQKNKENLDNLGNRFKVLEDNDNLVWVNMKAGGFGYYDEATKKIAFVLRTPDPPGYTLPNLVNAFYYDSAGILWLTTYEKELVKIILQSNDFKQKLLVEQNFTTTDNEVRGVLYDRKNRLWVGTKRGRLYVYQNSQPILRLFDNEPEEGLGLVYTILEDKAGNIWLGTKGNGLYKAVPMNLERTRYHLMHFSVKSNSRGLRGNEIYSLLEDSEGRIWVGSFDNGLNLVQQQGDSITFTHTGAVFTNYPKGAFGKIRYMTCDVSGNIWIATTDGLVLLAHDTRQSARPRVRTYSKIPGDKESLGNNDIQFIYKDSKNRMWLGTSGGGFSLAAGSAPLNRLKFRNYTTKDGMPNDYVLSCVEDQQGNLWIATENGLSKFHPETKIFRNYDSYDGLPKLSFSEAAACRSLPYGDLFFGTTKGFLTFHPEQINARQVKANIALTNLQINNQEARPGSSESILKTDVNYISDLTLKYNQNIISIDYAILDSRAGSRQAFSYRLVGFDTIWHDDRQLRRVTYTNLPFGQYVFEVKTLNTDLYSNSPYRRLAITILPPPWKTWWAYLLYTVCFLALLYFIRRYAIAMIRLRNKITVEQKLAALKLNFFTNVSHELRTPLTLIVNPLEQLSKKEKLSPEGNTLLEVALKNANRMIRFVNQLLDLRKVQSDKATLRISRVEMVSFIREVSNHFSDAARSKRINIDISFNDEELIAMVDAEKLDVVLYNLLGNAVKFSPAESTIKITVQVVAEEESFTIAVCDQGPGVPEHKLENIFELFQEGDNPGNRELKGTGIGLALSKEFVELHGGKIWAENNAGRGLTVTLKLQKGAAHYNEKQSAIVELPKPLVFARTLEPQILPPAGNLPEDKNNDSPLVLLVEDNEELRWFIKGQLREHYRVETANDGAEGLRKAIELVPDIIVSDIMMPVMDGIEMLDKVKQAVNTSHIPVVLLSAKYSVESQIEGLKYGADYYITKPFNNEFLIASVNNLLTQRRRLFESLVEKKKATVSGPDPIVITSKDELFLKSVIEVVEEKMVEVEFNIDSVAESMAMSRSTFYKKFKSLAGMAPVEFVRDMRLQKAKHLLDAGEHNISEVAYIVGFSNPKYFSTCFKEKYHLSPSEYLKLDAL